MIRRLRWIVLTLVVFMIAACSSGTAEERGSIEFRIDTPKAKAFLPAAIITPDKYNFTLLKVEGAAPSPDTASNKSQEFSTNDEGLYVMEGIKPGTYNVTIEGIKDSVVVSVGSTNITVVANKSVSASVQMGLASEGDYTGSAEITFDWSNVLDNENISKAMENGGIKFRLQRLDEDDNWIDVAESPSSTETSLTFTVNNIPVSTKHVFKYSLMTADGIVLNPALLTTTAHIYSGITSTPDGLQDGIYHIKDNDISEALNVYDVTWITSDASSVTMYWHNQYSSKQGCLFKKVEVSYWPKDNESAKKMIEVSTSGKDSNCRIEGLLKKTEYNVSFIAITNEGVRSSEYVYEYTVNTKVPVTEININKSKIPANIYVGSEGFELFASVNADATVQDIIWSSDHPEILEINGETATAKAVGQATITAKSFDNESITDTYEVTVTLASPGNVSAKVEAEQIVISWDSVPGAISYDIYRNNTKLNNAKEATTTYSDRDIYLSKEYSYEIVAVASDTAYNSAKSSSASATLSGSYLDILPPSLEDYQGEFEIKLSDVDYLMLTPDKPSVTINAGKAFQNASSFKWFINGTLIKSSDDFNAGASFITIDRADGNLKENTLFVKIETPSGTYEGSTRFLIIDKVPAKIICEAYSEETVYRVSNFTVYDEQSGTLSNPRTINLDAKTDSPDLPGVVYSSNNTDIATVDENGKIEFQDKGVYDEVTITIASAFDNKVKKEIKFDVYKPTITSAKQLLDIVNTDLSNAIKSADSSHDSDWVSPSDLGNWEGKYNGYDIVSSYTNTEGWISTSGKTLDYSITIKESSLPIRPANIGNGWATYGNKNKFETIYGTLNLDLPNNQGTASISYNDVNVLTDKTQMNAYTVTFDEVCGLDGNIKESYNFSYDKSKLM